MRLLTKEEVAVRGHMSLRKLEMLIKQQKGPKRTLVGKRGFITDTDCDEWLLSGREIRDQNDAA
jgi:hypothetical protein